MLKIIVIALLVILVGIIILFVYAKYRLNNIKNRKNLQGHVDTAAEKLIQSGVAYGLVLGIYKGGKTYVKGYGTIKKDERLQPNNTTIMELASTSKLFTSCVLQILCDEGTLNLDEKIYDLLKNKVELPPIARKTTLRQLATHTSGFPALPESFILKMTDENNPYKNLSTQDLYDYLKDCVGKKSEGKFEYSNFGMGLLGHIMELKTNKKFEDLVKEKLLSKLQMNNTFITPDSKQQPKIAQGYNEAGAPNPIWEDHVLTGAGSFMSDATDMIAFIRANLGAHHSPVSASLLKTHTQQTNRATGLGWMLPSSIDKFIGNKHILWHNGIAGGYASFIAIDKQAQCGIIVLSNTAKDITLFGMKMIRIVHTQSWKE